MTRSKSPARRLRLGVPVVAVALASACGAPEPTASPAASSTAVAPKRNKLYAKGANIWRTLNVPVCWEDGIFWSALQSAVRDQVAKTWSAATDVNFTGWGACTSSSTGIRIKVNEDRPHTTSLGRALDGDTAGMVLNFNFNTWSHDFCDTAANREFCVRAIAAHEFGHALGFAHEQNRSDTPASCTQEPQGEDGDTLIGPWDLNSIMNYCAPNWNNSGALTSGDIAGARLYYGGPNFKGTRRDALDYGNGKIYFFNGTVYTRFDTGDMRVDDFYPRAIAPNWHGWPSSWTSGVDAAVNWGNGKSYFFFGNQYLRYDMATDQVDAGYPTSITPNWHNWPASWTSVDAAVNWGNGKAYFFRGSEYIRVNVANHTVDAGYPRSISGNWPGVWSSGIEFVTTLDNGKAYFFKGSQYIRFDRDNNAADPGYPNVIAGNWPGVPF